MPELCPSLQSMRTAYRPTGSRLCARMSGLTCDSPTVRWPLHSSTQPAHGQRARSHLGGKRLSVSSSQRAMTPPSGEMATSVGVTFGTCGLILSRSPMWLACPLLMTSGFSTQARQRISAMDAKMLRSDVFFQAVALPYELVTRHPVWERDCARMAAELPRHCRLVADVGCGPGNSATYSRDAVQSVVAIAPARAMLHRARRRDPRLLLLRADAARLPLRDASVDAVTFHSVLYLLSDRAAVLRETARVLRPGGRAVLLEPRNAAGATRKGLLRALSRPGWAITALLWRVVSGWYGRLAPDELRALAEAAGLRVLKLDEALGGLGMLAVAERSG